MNTDTAFGLERAAWPAWLVSAGGAVLRANAAAVSLFGVALEGSAPQLSAIWSPENNGTVEQFLARWEQAPVAVAELKFRAANGATLRRKVAICAFNKDGQKWFVWQFLAQGEHPPEAAPVSDEAKNGVNSNDLLLKQKLDCALQLARTVSLDFNNALTSILGHTSFLLTKAESGHPWRLSLMEVEKSAAHAAEIANELSVFSRQEKDAPRIPPGNLNTVINRCVDFFRTSRNAAVGWKLHLENSLFAVRFDEAKLQQALTKILENAVEAVGNKGGQISVQTRNVELTQPTQDRNVQLAAGTYVCVEIADTGCGIETEVLPRIFEPFFTTKKGSHRGLGLALVYGIVANHGGGVAVSSQPGSGAAVRVYLPAEKQLINESAVANGNLKGSETVLVVDDEHLLLTMVETILTDYGYKTLTASSGAKALAILERGEPKVDLVITDLVMPGMSGRELVERIRRQWPATRLLCTSGYGMAMEKQTGTPYLRKPFTSAELLAKVKQAVL